MVIDSSALVAIILGESDAERFLDANAAAPESAVSAASLTEVVVTARQGDAAADDLHALVADLEVDAAAFDEEQAVTAHRAWRRFGKGRHTAALNVGDAMAYACAAQRGAPLLFKGQDFTQTDIGAVL
ncbi:MAG TPA: type II toxin-antitoxin system VapC family toxin [Tetrasphaera sp.]|uniref:type II toxin-antitoxin system VapC family toxin n=1 Tax=Nostocoides sp. TaxID=1917966 RepID=UPI002B6371C3|nr:type II toxin-antitoxin system VapC family toxin [Tetrasphaera sp.]HNQ05951.1 type II toxin-antitoxin system VapC family toxin [Tetrasphaera sp.]